MSVTTELEEKGIKIEELTADEKQTYFSMLDAVNDAQLTPEKIRDYIANMRDAVEIELTKTGLDGEQDMFLKARLKNYMLFYAFLTAPEKAKEALERAVSGMVKKS